MRLLLKKGRADPNITDYRRRTLLLVASGSRYPRVQVVRLLLEAGADLTLADEDGYISLRTWWLDGVDSTCSTSWYEYDSYKREEPSPSSSMLNQSTIIGETPLFQACFGGLKSVVSRLLSLRTVQGRTPNERKMWSIRDGCV